MRQLCRMDEENFLFSTISSAINILSHCCELFVESWNLNTSNAEEPKWTREEKRRRREINIELIVIVFILKEISGKWGEQHIHTILEMSSLFPWKMWQNSPAQWGWGSTLCLSLSFECPHTPQSSSSWKLVTVGNYTNSHRVILSLSHTLIDMEIVFSKRSSNILFRLTRLNCKWKPHNKIIL